MPSACQREREGDDIESEKEADRAEGKGQIDAMDVKTPCRLTRLIGVRVPPDEGLKGAAGCLGLTLRAEGVSRRQEILR